MIDEMIAVVQAYINHRKNITVQINIDGIKNSPSELNRLISAYNIAQDWFAKNSIYYDS